jgi:hypothetical protein
MGEHVYEVMGADMVDGTPMVTLYNPWGGDDAVKHVSYTEFLAGAKCVGVASLPR